MECGSGQPDSYVRSVTFFGSAATLAHRSGTVPDRLSSVVGGGVAPAYVKRLSMVGRFRRGGALGSVSLRLEPKAGTRIRVRNAAIDNSCRSTHVMYRSLTAVSFI